MTQNVIQTSFAAGELSPNLFAHVDMDQYRAGAATMRNFFVDYRSGASTRPGTRFVIQAYDATHPVRIIPFQTSVLVPYILEFGQNYMRPLSMGAPVLEPPFNVSAVNLGSPITITASGNNYAVGDWIQVSGTSIPQLDERFFIVSAVSGAVITLETTYSQTTNGAGYLPWVSGGVVNRVFKMASPYLGTDLALLKFIQVANIMYLTHPSYPPYTLTFTGPTSWTFAQVPIGAQVFAPTINSVTATGPGSTAYAYTVTSVQANGEESNPAPALGTNGAVDIGSTAGSIIINFSAPTTGATPIGYNVYKAEPAVNSSTLTTDPSFGFIGSMGQAGQFVDSNIVPDFTQTPPNNIDPFTGGNDPGCCCFFQQRLYYAGSNQFPQTFWASQPGYYDNFNTSDPIQADDAITGTLVSLQVNYIKAMVPMPGGLILLTSGGAWQLSSGQGGLASTAAVTPINATATPQAYNGISDVPPILINQDVLYVQYKNSIVRDLEYNIYANIYTGADISVVSNHLFFGYQIQQWAYAEEPFKVVWCVRNDGQLLSLSYLKEQKILGWARHDTLGFFQSVATVTEGNLDATYVVVLRTIPSVPASFMMIERMDNRRFVYGAEDAWSVDCGQQSALTYPNAYMFSAQNTTTGACSFEGTANVFVNSAAPAGSVGAIMRLGGGIAQITAVQSSPGVPASPGASAAFALGTLIQPITQVTPDGNPILQPPNNWSLTPQFTTFYGLDYLNGLTVSILADGNVVPQQTVVNGSITLQKPASKVTVGLPFVAQIQTMPIDLGDVRDSIQGRRKKISALNIRLSQTRGLYYGHDFNTMTPIKEFSQGQVLGSTIPLVTGDERVIMDPLWDVPGQICLQMTDPLCATVLGVIPEVVVGDTAK